VAKQALQSHSKDVLQAAHAAFLLQPRLPKDPLRDMLRSLMVRVLRL
jgi:hypothetical protein